MILQNVFANDRANTEAEYWPINIGDIFYLFLNIFFGLVKQLCEKLHTKPHIQPISCHVTSLPWREWVSEWAVS